MADKPKEAPKSNSHEVLYFLIAVLVIGYFVVMFINAFPSLDAFNTYLTNFGGGSNGWYVNFLGVGQTIISWYSKIVVIVSALFILAIAYASMRHREILHNEKKHDKALAHASSTTTTDNTKTNTKWEKILSHVNSTNPAEWRLSILEADVLLEELLDSMHFVGTTLGDKLKGADPASFKTIQLAWEAHKIRNAIAHEGADFLVSQREAKRVIGLFEQVFKEFDFI